MNTTFDNSNNAEGMAAESVSASPTKVLFIDARVPDQAALVAAAEPFVLLNYYPSMLTDPTPIQTLIAAISKAKELLP